LLPVHATVPRVSARKLRRTRPRLLTSGGVSGGGDGWRLSGASLVDISVSCAGLQPCVNWLLRPRRAAAVSEVLQEFPERRIIPPLFSAFCYLVFHASVFQFVPLHRGLRRKRWRRRQVAAAAEGRHRNAGVDLQPMRGRIRETGSRLVHR